MSDKKLIRNPLILLNYNNRKEAQPLEPMIENNNKDIIVKSRDMTHNISMYDSIKQRLYREGYVTADELDTDLHVFGMVIDMDESDSASAITYTMDNKVFNPISLNEDGTCNYGSWSTYLHDIFGVVPCIRSDTGNLEYLNKNNYNKGIDGSSKDITDKNIVIEFKRTFYKIEMNNNLLIFKVANYKVDNTYRSDAFLSSNNDELDAIYIGAYPCSLKDEKLSSQSGYTADDISDNFNLIDYNKYIYLYLLTLLFTKNTNISNITSTFNHDNYVSGKLNECGLFANNSNGYKILGIESLFGGSYIKGIKIKDNTLLFNNTGDINNEELYKKSKDIETRTGYISKFSFNNGMITPDVLNGTSNNYFGLLLSVVDTDDGDKVYANESGYTISKNNLYSIGIGVF